MNLSSLCGYFLFDSFDFNANKQSCHKVSKVQIVAFAFTFVIHLRYKSIDFHAGPEGLEPSTSCSAGSHSIQTELWAQTFLTEFLI
jgi:hypothetical protein